MSAPSIPTLTTRCRVCYQLVPARKIATALMLSVHTEEHSSARCSGSNAMQPMAAAPLAVVSAVSSTGAV